MPEIVYSDAGIDYTFLAGARRCGNSALDGNGTLFGIMCSKVLQVGTLSVDSKVTLNVLLAHRRALRPRL